MTPLKDKLRAAVVAYAPLTDLLGTNPCRWWNVQLRQGAAFPAIVALIASDAPTYAFGGPLQASFSRVQMTIWDTNPERLEQVDAALQSFVAQYNGAGLATAPAQANYVLNRRDGMFAQTQPPQYQRVIDVKVFDNPNVS